MLGQRQNRIYVLGEREREEGKARRNSTEREAGDMLHCRRLLETDQLPRERSAQPWEEVWELTRLGLFTSRGTFGILSSRFDLVFKLLFAFIFVSQYKQQRITTTTTKSLSFQNWRLKDMSQQGCLIFYYGCPIPSRKC